MSLPSGQKPRHATISALQVSGGIDKRDLRRELLKKRLALDEATRNQWDAAIGARLRQFLQERQVASLGVFWPIRNEPDLRGLYETLAQQGVRLALPLVVAQDAPLEFAAWKPGDDMVPETLGILVPRNKTPVELPEALLAPCVGFNAARYRLGYGGGFFDRTLAVTARPYAIGIAYAFQEAVFPVEEFDVPLDCIVTENALLR